MARKRIIYVSSTYVDLQAHRAALKAELERAGYDVESMERYAAFPEPPPDKCLEDVAACDAYVLLIAHRYGDSDTVARLGKSVTELEYDKAQELEKPSFVFTVSEDFPWPPKLMQRGQKTGKRLDALRARAMSAHGVKAFTTPDDLTKQVLAALSSYRWPALEEPTLAGPAKKPIHLPYPCLGDLFKGRDAMLGELRTSLTNAPATGASAIVGKALHGLGGVGKTRLAVEYAWRHADDYTALLFVGADSPEALRRDLAALCGPALLDLPEHRVAEEAAQVAAVIAWLQCNPGWLLIADNVDTEAAAEAVEALLPQLSGGHVLITSRLTNWSGGVEALPLDVVQPPAAVEFLLARTDARRRKQADDAAQAGTLAGELGGLALALEQAGAYIAQRRLTLADYLAEWRGERDKLLAWSAPRLVKYPKSVAVTWQTSFDQLGEPARRLLQRLAWLAAAPIPESLLDVAVPGAAARDDVHAALAELESYSLVTRADAVPSFTVHRLVQEVTRGGADVAALTEALGWINDAFIGDPGDVRTWPVLDPLVPHARAVAGHADEAGIAAPTARLMNESARLLHNKALHAEAEPLMRRALAIDEKSFGPEYPNVAIHLNNLATLLQDTNRLPEAEPLIRRALAIDEKSFGVEHPNVATRLNNLAQLLQDTNRLTEAEPLMHRALAIDEKSFGPEHPRVALRLNNLAELLKATNRLAEAEPLIRRALAIDEKSFGAEHPNVATRLNNLAALLNATNRLAEAEPLMRRALAIDEKSFGPDHPNVARHLNNLAQLLQATNRLAEAEPLIRRALAIDTNSFGPEHPRVALRLNNLAALLKATNRLAEAEPLMRRALAIFVASLGADHPNSETVMENYAVLLGEMGHSKEEVLERFQSLRRGLLGQSPT